MVAAFLAEALVWGSLIVVLTGGAFRLIRGVRGWTRLQRSRGRGRLIG